MLDAFIIEEIKRRERLRREEKRPEAELPIPDAEDPGERRTGNESGPDETPKRGVIVVDLLG